LQTKRHHTKTLRLRSSPQTAETEVEEAEIETEAALAATGTAVEAIVSIAETKATVVIEVSLATEEIRAIAEIEST
jgi:hypothetical protein